MIEKTSEDWWTTVSMVRWLKISTLLKADKFSNWSTFASLSFGRCPGPPMLFWSPMTLSGNCDAENLYSTRKWVVFYTKSAVGSTMKISCNPQHSSTFLQIYIVVDCHRHWIDCNKNCTNLASVLLFTIILEANDMHAVFATYTRAKECLHTSNLEIFHQEQIINKDIQFKL